MIHCTASGTDAVVDTFAVALNQGAEGHSHPDATPTALASLLRRASPMVLLEASSDGLDIDTEALDRLVRRRLATDEDAA